MVLPFGATKLPLFHQPNTRPLYVSQHINAFFLVFYLCKSNIFINFAAGFNKHDYYDKETRNTIV